MLPIANGEALRASHFMNGGKTGSSRGDARPPGAAGAGRPPYRHAGGRWMVWPLGSGITSGSWQRAGKSRGIADDFHAAMRLDGAEVEILPFHCGGIMALIVLLHFTAPLHHDHKAYYVERTN